MALKLIAIVSPCITYTLYYEHTGPFGAVYNPWLITPPRIYQECIAAIDHFFYEPGSDKLVAYIWFNQIDWPGWALYRYEWNAGTGAFISRTNASWSETWCNHAGLGSYGSIYTTMKSTTKIYEVPWMTMLWQSAMWNIDPYTWTPKRIFTHVVVNREDNLIAGVSGMNLEVWSLSGTPTLRGTLRMPMNLGYLAYENRENCWLVTQNGLVAKANYRMLPPRWEILTMVQDPSPDAVNYLCAFDTRRKRLAIFRQRPDAEHGACQCQLEFYRPLYVVTGLTDPVPVTALRAGEKVRFIAHLHGEAGEGVTPYEITGELLAPASGQLLNAIAGTELTGGSIFRYQAPLSSCTDKLKLSATIPDGD